MSSMRLLYNLLVLVSSMALAITIAGWVASHRDPISVSIFDMPAQAPGSFRFNLAFSAEGDKLCFYFAHSRIVRADWRWHYLFYRTTMIGNAAKLSIYRHETGTWGNSTLVLLPCWSVAIACSVLPGIWAWKFRRQERPGFPIVQA